MCTPACPLSWVATASQQIIELHLTPEEQEKFNASCKTMSENYQLSLTL